MKRSRRVVVGPVVVVLVVGALLALGVASGMAQDPRTLSDGAYRESILEWRQGRLERLTSDTGYLSLAGLLWLEEGEFSIGSGPDDDLIVRREVAPHRACILRHRDGITTVEPTAGIELFIGETLVDGAHTLAPDTSGKPDMVKLGVTTFVLIERAGRWGIRLSDPQSPVRAAFTHIDSWDIDRSYLVVARFAPYDPPRKLPIVNEVGFIDSMWSTGSLHFELNGQQCSMDALVDTLDDDYLFLIFRDVTSGVETYGAGRFLYTDAPANGRVLVDFNKAYNPPCAFSPYTTCPIPPLQNELDIAIRAGEKDYTGPATPASH